MAVISKKKVAYKINPLLQKYLQEYDREIPSFDYQDLLRYDNSIPVMDRNGQDTLWETVFYPQSEMGPIHDHLKKIYSNLKADGDVSVIEHLYIDRIDLCPFGNSKPFRIRIVNEKNDNFDYFYVKNADASRIYGLELEHILSPNRINYMVDKNTLIEEHIAGVPGDLFVTKYMRSENLNKVRIAKEFVKFNERCFIRLLGDMHSSNFVIDITPDFEETHYRIRAIDFDQQSYEGRKNVYMPQYYKQNIPYVELAMELMTPESVFQYQLEERSLIMGRVKIAGKKLTLLLEAMCRDTISKKEYVMSLRKELAKHFKNNAFLKCETMGELVHTNLRMLSDHKKS